MTAALYARFSPRPKDKLNTLTLDVQLERMAAYCEQHGLTVGLELREPKTSAKTPLEKRPKGAELIAAIKAGKIQHVVAYRLDRLFRNIREALNRIHEWDQAGISIHFLDFMGGQVDTKSPMGRCMLAVCAAFKELEREETAARTSEALRYRQRNGLATGNPPYGWRRKTIDGTTVLVPDLIEQEAVAFIKRFGALGESHRHITARLNVPPIKRGCRGVRWTHRTVGRILKRAEAGLEPGTSPEFAC